MVNLKLMAVMMVAVLQMCRCTANAVSSNDPADSDDANNPEKSITEDEFARAKSVGLEHWDLVRLKYIGLTFEESIKYHELEREMKLNRERDMWSWSYVSKICEILIPDHKMASNYTTAHEKEFRILLNSLQVLPSNGYIHIIRTSVCSFISQPQSFDPKYAEHTSIRIIKNGNEGAEWLHRVRVAVSKNLLRFSRALPKLMCCIDEGGTILDKSKVNGLPDEEMNEFDQQWKDFDTTNVPESIIKMCDFLHYKKSIDADQCKKID